MDANTRRIEEDLLPFYALDALTEDEKAEVEAYLAAHPEARHHLDDYVLGVEALVLSVRPEVPDPATKARLMERVAATSAPANPPTRVTAPKTSPRPAPRPWFSWPSAALAFSLVLVAGLGWAVLSLRSQMQQTQSDLALVRAETVALAADNDRLQAEVGRQDTQITGILGTVDSLAAENAQLREEIRVQNDQLALFRAPGAVTISIGAISDEAEGAVALVTVAPDGASAILQASNLPLLDDDQDYQLWFIAEGVPQSAAVFNVSGSGEATLTTGPIPDGLQAIGISREPAGGSDQPTPDQIILLGETST